MKHLFIALLIIIIAIPVLALQKNVASQKIGVFAYDDTTGDAKTGDAVQITSYVWQDWTSGAASDDTNPTELDSTNAPGIYVFDMLQDETNADVVALYAKSSTSNIKIHPVILHTTPPNFPDATIATATALATAQTELDKIGTIPALDSAAQTIGAAIAKLADDNGGASYDATTDSQREIKTHADTIKAETALIVADTGELQTNQGAWATATGFSTLTASDNIGINWADVTNKETANDFSYTTVATVTNVGTVGTVSGLANNVITAASTHSDFVTEVAGAVTTSLNSYDPPTNAEFEARTLPSADYTVVGDLGTVQTGDTYALANSGTYGFSALETLVDGIEAKTDNLPTDPADASVVAGLIATAQADLDTITDTDGVVVASASKTGYALSTAGVDAILDDTVESTYTLRQCMRIAMAWMAGDMAISGSTYTYTGLDGVTTRVEGTVGAGGRTVGTLDGD